ncbi:MAG: tetratricopeptide repeat protein [Polyangiaceae bacterium]
MRRRGLVALAFACLLATSSTAKAEPTLWDVAKDPKVLQAHQALVAVERMMLRAEGSAFDPSMQQRFMRAGLAMLELSGAGMSDPRLQIVLGELLVDSAVQRDREGRDLLLQAVKAAPDSPLAGRAWFNIAIASARLREPDQEHEAYTHALDSVWEPDFRANILMNRGESAMVMGELSAALGDYRQAVKLATRPELVALAHYGLGITLERRGNLPAALNAMQIARSIRLPLYGSALDLPSVFFVPEYDIHYYKALSAMAAERNDTSPAKKRRFLDRAVLEWDAYLGRARPEATPWVKRAELHRARCERARDAIVLPRKAARRAGGTEDDLE